MGKAYIFRSILKNSILITFLFFILFQGFGQQKYLNVEELQDQRLMTKPLQNLQWISGSDNFSFITNTALVVCKASTDKRDTVIRLKEINNALSALKIEEQKKFPQIRWKDDRFFTFVLKNHLLGYDLPTGKLTELNSWAEKAANVDIDYNMYTATYTVENNLFLSVNGQEIPLSNDAEKGISSGSSNVFRHEWGTSKGTFWSPKGNLLAFYRMDETMVADYPLVDITTEIATVKKSKYPMAGKASHEVLIGVCNISKGKIIFLKTGEPKDQFLTNIAWSPDEKYIFVAVLNRAQNQLDLKKYDATTGECVAVVLSEHNDRYVEPLNPPKFLVKNPSLFIWQSQRDGYNHLYLGDVTGKTLKQLTKGSWVVSEYYGTDAEEKRVFFSAREQGPLEKHLYSVEISSGKITRLSNGKGMHSGLLSESGSFILDNFNSPEIPARTTVADSKGKVIYQVMEQENPLRDYKLGEAKVVGIASAGNPDLELYARLIKPVDFDPSKRYPVVIYVYGGPHSQMVTYSWLYGANLYLNYLATKGYVVFTLDNRGTSNRGQAFENCIHRNLGTLEVADQMDGVKYLKSLPFVDTARIGIDGWSYGGFMTLSMLTSHPGVFKAACAGGPVIDWKYYEVMYGERYMDTPEENPTGYKNAGLLDKADKLNAKLLILQGTMDETVVWQNSQNFVKKCIDAGKQVDYFVFPGHEHNVRGKDRIYMFKKIVGFFDANLK